MRGASKKWRTGCFGLLVVLGGCLVAGRLAPRSPATTAARQSSALPLVVNTPEPTVTETPAPLPTVTPEPIDTVAPTEIPTEVATALPTDTEVPTDVPTEPAVATDTPVPTEAPAQAATECVIKGNVNSKGEKIYHLPGDRDYERTKIKPEEGDQLFCSVAEAEAAGFRAPLSR